MLGWLPAKPAIEKGTTFYRVRVARLGENGVKDTEDIGPATRSSIAPVAGAGMDRTASGQASHLRAGMIGAILGVDAVGHCIALATLCFAGTLSAGLGLGAFLFLASSVVIAVVLAFGSGFKVALGLSQDTSIAILAPAALAAATAAAAAGGDGTAQIATAVAVIASAAVLSGLAFLTVGLLGLGSIVRLVPYPVAAGFLASSGWLLVAAALMIVSGTTSLAEVPARIGEPAVWGSILAATSLGVVLFLMSRRNDGGLGFVLCVLGTVFLFHVVLWLTGLGADGARALHLLPELTGGMPGAGEVLALYRAVDWNTVILQAPVLATVVVINLIGLMLNISGVEIAGRRDVDVNRELRITGLANLLIGAFGGVTGFMTSGSSAVAHRFGLSGPAVGLGFVAVVVLGSVFAQAIVATVPVFVAAGLLLFIGSALLMDWLVETRKRLVLTDWAIIPAIVAVTVVFGILPAVLAGLAFAILAFVIGYARLPVVRHATTGQNRRSTLERAPGEEALLATQGNHIRILQLQGFLFFGSLERLVRRIRSEMDAGEAGPMRERMLILDLSGVTGLDSAGCSALAKLGYLAQARNVSIHLAALPDAVSQTVNRWGLDLSGKGGLRHWPSVDAALEHCESVLIADAAMQAVPIVTRLQQLGGNHPRSAELMALMDRIELQPGERLIGKGSRAMDVYFLESGRLAVMVAPPGGVERRVSSLAPGSVVGEIARYMDGNRSADVVVEKAAVVYCLSQEVQERLDREDRDLAALAHAIFARALAEKVLRTNRQLPDR
jgi:sulfate permease, SulP family